MKTRKRTVIEIVDFYKVEKTPMFYIFYFSHPGGEDDIRKKLVSAITKVGKRYFWNL